MSPIEEKLDPRRGHVEEPERVARRQAHPPAVHPRACTTVLVHGGREREGPR